jgi:uncharacterized protein
MCVCSLFVVDVSLAETVKAAEFFGTDGVIITGVATGAPTEVNDVMAARKAVRQKKRSKGRAHYLHLVFSFPSSLFQTKLPVAVGSGVDPTNIAALWPYTDVFIVGSYIKVNETS